MYHDAKPRATALLRAKLALMLHMNDECSECHARHACHASPIERGRAAAHALEGTFTSRKCCHLECAAHVAKERRESRGMRRVSTERCQSRRS